MDNINLNKVISIEDFNNSEISDIIYDAFSFETEGFPKEHQELIPDSKQWESAMCIKAFRDHGVLNRDAVILGVGAGTEVLSFYLTRFVKQVFATDLYLGAGDWSDVAPFLMLLEPEAYSPYHFERDRLVVQHMDGRWVQYPDNSFDGIYSSGSIEHFGGLSAAANASFEMGRVLKPGGILTLATEFKVSGPSNGDGWDINTLIFSIDKIKKYIVEASGLELVDNLDFTVSDNTMQSQRNLVSFLEGIKNGSTWEQKKENYPNLILVHEGYVFCSIHLALQKTANYPLIDNSWAKPSDETKAKVSQLRQQIAMNYTKRSNRKEALGETSGESIFSSPSEKPLTMDDIYAIMHQHNEWHRLWLSLDQTTKTNSILKRSRLLSFVYRTVGRIRKLGKFLEAQRLVNEAIIISIRKIMYDGENMREQIKNHEAVISQQQEDILELKKLIRETRKAK